MRTPSSEQLRHELSRFYYCYDGLLRSAEVVYHEGGERTNVYIVVSAIDSQSNDDEGWCNLHLEVHDVQELRMTEEGPRGGYEVLSGGIAAALFDGLYYFDFTLGVDPEDNDLRIEEFRRSEFYVAGRSFAWHTAPYTHHAVRRFEASQAGTRKQVTD